MRWHTRAQASLDQHRRAPFAPQSAPQSRRLPAPAIPAIRRSAARSSTPVKVSTEVPEHRAQASAGHLATSSAQRPARTTRPVGIAPADWPHPQTHLTDSLQRGCLGARHRNSPRCPDLPKIVRGRPRHGHARRRIAMHALCDQLRRALQLYSFPAITRNAEDERLPGQHRQHRGRHRLLIDS